MQERLFETLYSEWKEELGAPLYESRSLYIAVFSPDDHLMLANKSMMDLFRGDPSKSLQNPTLGKLRSMSFENALVYEGYLTIGDNINHFSSIQAKVFRKNDRLLIVGSVDVGLMAEQNDVMRRLNDEISNLQRQLMKEKVALEKTYDQLNLANANLKESNATKDKFLSIMAHDLKNPFAVLLGFSDILMDSFSEFDKEQIFQQIEIIHKTVHKTYQLLEDLLLWSRSQLGRIEFQPTNMNLDTICKDVALSLSEIADKKSIRLEVRVSPELEVLADKNMLKTILRNLITNAIKFSWHDSIVTIYAEHGPQMVSVSISDHGVGIGFKQQEKIWKLSEQVSTAGTDKEDGSGLGLLLCKEFAEKQGGTIGVVSEPGNGSVFCFTVPRGKMV